MIKNRILKKLSAGLMAGLCAFSMFGSSMSGAITASAASTPMETRATGMRMIRVSTLRFLLKR